MKTTQKTEPRVVVWPRSLGNLGAVRLSDRMVEPDEERRAKEYEDRCAQMLDQVKRHVDNVGDAHVKYTIEHTCGHCGSAWTEDSDVYNGGCCDDDEENNPEPMP